jgi:hypothetical protein
MSAARSGAFASAPFGLATLVRPDPYRSMPHPRELTIGECAACCGPCESFWWGFDDEVRFCAECLERGRPAGPDEDLGGSG